MEIDACNPEGMQGSFLKENFNSMPLPSRLVYHICWHSAQHTLCERNMEIQRQGIYGLCKSQQ